MGGVVRGAGGRCEEVAGITTFDADEAAGADGGSGAERCAGGGCGRGAAGGGGGSLFLPNFLRKPNIDVARRLAYTSIFVDNKAAREAKELPNQICSWRNRPK